MGRILYLLISFLFVSIFARIDKLNFLKKITYLQLLAISCLIIPMGLSILASNIGIIDKKIILSKIFQSHNMIEHINKNYKNEKIFTKLNYFYYFDNIVPVYHYTIVKKFDPDYYRKNEKNTKLIYLESPNSWTFEMQDLEKIADFAKKNKLITIIDNSYASPINCNPHVWGIDIVVHSATKYISGHGDVMGGVVCSTKKIIDQIFGHQYKVNGGIISPFNSWLFIRGLRTLEMRMKFIAENTPKVVSYLEKHPKINKVIYPHGKDFKQKDLVDKYLKKPCGQFSIQLKTSDKDEIESFCNKLKYFKMACSWGGHESLIFPEIANFGNEYFDESEALPLNFVRFYVGLEDSKFLIKDIEKALS